MQIKNTDKKEDVALLLLNGLQHPLHYFAVPVVPVGDTVDVPVVVFVVPVVPFVPVVPVVVFVVPVVVFIVPVVVFVVPVVVLLATGVIVLVALLFVPVLVPVPVVEHAAKTNIVTQHILINIANFLFMILLLYD
jgi:hypothetical protein